MTYDALLVLSFGGPEGPDDVMPFLENVTRGRGVPPERLAGVAEHYLHFGGVSPINAQNRALIAAVEADLAAHGIELPIYWGNRNWHPFVTDTVREMAADGVRRAVVFVTSAYASYSSCRQYQDDLAAAREAVGDGAPELDKLRHFFDHPGFIEPQVDAVRSALAAIDSSRRAHDARLVFTAHSIPMSMAAQAGPDGGLYVAQLMAASRLIAAAAAPDVRVEPGVPEPKWAAVRAVARAGHQRSPAGRWPARGHRRRGRPGRVRQRPPRGAVGSRRRGCRCRGRARARLHPYRDARNGPALRRDGARARPGTPRRQAAPKLALSPLGPSHDTCPAGCCPPSR